MESKREREQKKKTQLIIFYLLIPRKTSGGGRGGRSGERELRDLLPPGGFCLSRERFLGGRLLPGLPASPGSLPAGVGLLGAPSRGREQRRERGRAGPGSLCPGGFASSILCWFCSTGNAREFLRHRRNGPGSARVWPRGNIPGWALIPRPWSIPGLASLPWPWAFPDPGGSLALLFHPWAFPNSW